MAPRMSPGAKAYNLKDVALSTGKTPAQLPNVPDPDPTMPSIATPRGDNSLANGETGGNYKQPDSAVGAGFAQIGATESGK